MHSISRALILSLLVATTVPLFAQDKPVDPVLVPGKSVWPKASIPAAIIEYTAGKVANYGNGGESNWYLIYCVEDSQADVDAYIGAYERAGWKIGKDGATRFAEKDNLLVFFRFQPLNKLLGIEINTLSTTKQWPVKEFPMLPPLTRCQSSDFTQNEYDLTVAVYKVAETDMRAYYGLLASKGWVVRGEETSFVWKKSTPEVELQIEDQGSGTYYFSVSYSTDE